MPVFTGFRGGAEPLEGATQPEMNVTVVSQEMPRFPKILRRGQRGLKMTAGEGGVAGIQSGAPERNVRTHVLSQRPAFPAFPWLKPAGTYQPPRLFVLPGLIVERA